MATANDEVYIWLTENKVITYFLALKVLEGFLKN